MSKVSFSDLTKVEVATVSNGCGARHFFKPPYIKVFTASCDQHDFYYARGYTFTDKVRADSAFLGHLIQDAAKTDTLIKIVSYTFLAIVYYLAVSFFGHFSFNYGLDYATKKQILSKEVLNG